MRSDMWVIVIQVRLEEFIAYSSLMTKWRTFLTATDLAHKHELRAKLELMLSEESDTLDLVSRMYDSGKRIERLAKGEKI
jgi:hypothetical protein